MHDSACDLTGTSDNEAVVYVQPIVGHAHSIRKEWSQFLLTHYSSTILSVILA